MARNGHNGKDPVLVIVQLSGGNDFMNTLIPYTAGVYHDSRPVVGIPADKVLPMDDEFGWHPSSSALKDMFDDGTVAVVQGIGYPNSSRSHFRAMDIWHTCEPVEVGTEGWLGRATREIDPNGENVLTAVNFGRGLPRALAVPGVPITSVGDLENYGLMTGIDDADQRKEALDVFKQMYAPAVGNRAGDGLPRPHGLGRAEGRRRAQEGARRRTSRTWSTAATPSPRASATWRECTWRGLARASSTRTTAGTTPTPTRCRRIRSFSAT